MSSWSVHTLPLSLRVSTVIGAALLVVGLGVYVVGISLALARVRSQYSRALPESRSIRVGSALVATARLWPFLVIAGIGAVILLAGR